MHTVLGVSQVGRRNLDCVQRMIKLQEQFSQLKYTIVSELRDYTAYEVRQLVNQKYKLLLPAQQGRGEASRQLE